LVICAALAALALPPLAGAEEQKVPSSGGIAAPAEEGRVDASELTNLLVQKGLITSQEQKKLTHPEGAPSFDDQTMQEYFRTPPYHREGWRGGS
jgi:hypothetical protein